MRREYIVVGIKSCGEIVVSDNILFVQNAFKDSRRIIIDYPIFEIDRHVNEIYLYEELAVRLQTTNWDIEPQYIGKYFKIWDVKPIFGNKTFVDVWGYIMTIDDVTRQYINSATFRTRRELETINELRTKSKVFGFLSKINEFYNYAVKNGIEIGENVFCWKRDFIITIIHPSQYVGISIPTRYPADKFIRDVEEEIRRHPAKIQAFKEIANAMLNIKELQDYALALITFNIV